MRRHPVGTNDAGIWVAGMPTTGELPRTEATAVVK